MAPITLCCLLLALAGGGSPPDRAWPVPGAQGASRPVVLRLFDPPATPWGAGHRGVDLHTDPGATVVAAAPGTVVFAGQVGGRGVISIELAGDDGPPMRITYEPVRATVAAGEEVTAGQPVGILESGPYHCDRPCLHWGFKESGTRRYQDPLSLLPAELLRPGPSRLLPVHGVPLPGNGPGHPVQRDPHGGTGDLGRVVEPGQRPAHRGVHHSLEERRRRPRLGVPQAAKRFGDQLKQAAVRRLDLLPGRRVKFHGGQRHHRSVPTVAGKRELRTHIGLHLAARRVRRGHRRLDLGGPQGEVDRAQRLDHRPSGAEVLVDGGTRQARTGSKRGEGQCGRSALGQQ